MYFILPCKLEYNNKNSPNKIMQERNLKHNKITEVNPHNELVAYELLLKTKEKLCIYFPKRIPHCIRNVESLLYLLL